ncbi:uncharacterized protein F4822DRAFT_426826 [Hypoxylon trugodes]|uniref:uncharacterized protein n=1 Tax=Hypoxylon trugodes TaxID=326681 RepID=UPI00218E7638|nr:uncharacterized protein F4822DRAFT_426826 [Hypoxylon trugodes]KAI1390973.1 hypothetical protein F4822DRAFT_426826 [Hypoxylon trugodes]
MVGRRRRAASTSTVATIDESAIPYFTEESILKPASVRVHTDDWPCFLLADATIYHQDGTLANLLHVDLEGPLIVRGRLEIEKDQERHLVHKNLKGHSPWIQIQNSLSFSIGLKDDGLPMPVLWASGLAGWFEIIPSDAYREICDNMYQGISLHYALLDAFEAALEELQEEQKKKEKKIKKTKTIGDVKFREEIFLFKYAVTVGDGVTFPEALQRISDHAIFLLSHFPKDTRFYQWMTKKFPDISKKLAGKDSNDPKNASKADSGPLTAKPYNPADKSNFLEVADSRGKTSSRNSAPKTLRSSEASSPGVVNVPSDDRRHAKPGRPRKKSHRSDVVMRDAPQVSIEDDTARLSPQQIKGHNTGAPSDAGSSLSVLLEVLLDIRRDISELFDQGKQKKHPDEINYKGWCNKLYLELSIKNPKALPEVCEYFASDLVQLLSPEWHNSQFYQWLKENINTKPKFELISEEDMKQIVRRKKKGKASHEDTHTPTQEPEPTTKVGEQQASGRRLPRRGRPSGKVAGLRLSTGGKKRLRHETSDADEMDIDEDGIYKTSKKSKYFGDEQLDEHDEDENDTDSSAVSDDEDVENEGDAQLARVVIRAEKLPSTTPTGPDQTWTCEEPDCGYVVRAADQEEGQALINQHFEAHEKDAQEEAERNAASQSNLEGLALQESQRGHLPIDHLLAKIRSIGDKTQKRGEVRLNGEILPQPIKRGLLI